MQVSRKQSFPFVCLRIELSGMSSKIVGNFLSSYLMTEPIIGSVATFKTNFISGFLWREFKSVLNKLTRTWKMASSKVGGFSVFAFLVFKKSKMGLRILYQDLILSLCYS